MKSKIKLLGCWQISVQFFTESLHLKVRIKMQQYNMVIVGRYKSMPLFYTFYHPIYTTVYSYLSKVKQFLLKNTTFTNSNLMHNHQARNFLLEGKIRRQWLLQKAKFNQILGQQFHKKLMKLN